VRGLKFTKHASPELIERAKSKLIMYTPRTPGTRHRIDIDRSELWKGGPVMELTVGLRKHGGRNNSGKITVRHRGGGHRRRYRFIDFKRAILDQPAVVQRLEYDPNRTCHIALVAYPDGTVSYILAPEDLNIGDSIVASRTQEVDLRVGNAMPLHMMPIGTVVHNLEMAPGKGGQIARAAGTSCTLVGKNSRPGFALVKITSREQRLIPLDCLGTIGSVSNPFHKLQKLGKAGRSRHRGIRPTVRGVAMNPVDHPMGGGEGKAHGGRPSCSPEGLKSKGLKTRKKQHYSNKYIAVTARGRSTGRIQTN